MDCTLKTVQVGLVAVAALPLLRGENQQAVLQVAYNI